MQASTYFVLASKIFPFFLNFSIVCPVTEQYKTAECGNQLTCDPY